MKVYLKLKDTPIITIKGDDLSSNHGYIFNRSKPVIQWNLDHFEYIIWDEEYVDFEKINEATQHTR